LYVIRCGSPIPGGSTLMTSAPKSESTVAAPGSSPDPVIPGFDAERILRAPDQHAGRDEENQRQADLDRKKRVLKPARANG
jgi:hypothetical protein